MDRNEIISKLCKEAAETTPDLYDKISSAAKAQNLLGLNGAGAPSGNTSAANGSGVVKASTKTASKSKIAAIASIALAGVIAAATAITLPIVLTSNNDNLGGNGVGSTQPVTPPESSTPPEGSTPPESETVYPDAAQTVVRDGLKYVLSNDKTHYSCVGFADEEAEIATLSDEQVKEIVIASVIDGVPVKAIGDGAFAFCHSLVSVTLPDSVKELGSEAFLHCDLLESITLSKNLTEIKSSTFMDCYALKSINIPDGVTIIGGYAFQSCIALESVDFSENLTKIGRGAFGYCEALTSITLPEGLTRISEYAFNNCPSVEYISIPNSLTELGDYAFSGCNKANYTEYSNGRYIGNNNNPYLILVSAAGYVSINDDTKFIHAEAFQYNSSIYYKIDLPRGLLSIGEAAFLGCNNMGFLELPGSVTYIGPRAFQNCRSLERVIMTIGTKFIGCCAFANCSPDLSIEYFPDDVFYSEDINDYLIYSDDDGNICYTTPY